MKHEPHERSQARDSGAGLQVHSVREQDEGAWDDFVVACPEATFFHRYGWKRILERVLRHRTHYLVARQHEQIVGVLPLAEVRTRLFGHSLASLPFCVYGCAACSVAYARTEPLRSSEGGISPRLHALNRALRLCPGCETVHLEVARNLWQLSSRSQALCD